MKEIWIAIITGLFGILIGISPVIVSYFLGKKKKKGEDSHIKLKHHPVFVRMKAYQSYVRTSFFLENKGKQEVFRDLLLSQIQIIYDVLAQLADDVEVCCEICESQDIECNKLYNKNMEALRKTVDLFSQHYRSSEYTLQEQQVMEIVLCKFNEWQESRVKRMEETIPTIYGSKFYPDCHTRQAVIFDMYLGTVSDMIGDAEKTISEINGDLKGLVFRGITI